MSSKEYDAKVWKEINEYYNKFKSELDTEREKNKDIDFYSLSEKDNKKTSALIKRDPYQRLFSRFLKSYISTTWNKIRGRDKNDNSTNNKTVEEIVEDWLSDDINIIETVKDFCKKNKENNKLKHFCKFNESVLKIIESPELLLSDYNFESEQINNFKKLSNVIENKFNSIENEFNIKKLSSYEKTIYNNAEEPYKTILKMQKVIYGFGIALSCDFLKEAHFCNIAKPDVHICQAFSVIDGISYSMDLALVKRVAEFANNVCEAKSDNFCNTGAYNVDKIIWLICKDYNKNVYKQEMPQKANFLNELANMRKQYEEYKKQQDDAAKLQ